jgi:hypothetical protein
MLAMAQALGKQCAEGAFSRLESPNGPCNGHLLGMDLPRRRNETVRTKRAKPNSLRAKCPEVLPCSQPLCP